MPSLLNSTNYPVYDLPGDKVTGTATHNGTSDASFPIANIFDERPWKPAKFTVNPTTITIDHGSAKRMDLVSFIHCGVIDGAVHVQRNAADSWGAPSMDVTVSGTGITEDLMPTNPWVDLTAATGYNGATGFRYTRLTFANTALLSLGLVRLSSTLRQFSVGLQIGAKDDEAFPDIDFLTYGSVQLGYSIGVRPRSVAGQVTVDASTYATLRSWHRSTVGTHSPFLLIPEPNVNEAWWVQWGMDSLERTRMVRGNQTVQLAWNEVGRGLKP